MPYDFLLVLSRLFLLPFFPFSILWCRLVGRYYMDKGYEGLTFSDGGLGWLVGWLGWAGAGWRASPDMLGCPLFLSMDLLYKVLLVFYSLPAFHLLCLLLFVQ